MNPQKILLLLNKIFKKESEWALIHYPKTTWLLTKREFRDVFETT